MNTIDLWLLSIVFMIILCFIFYIILSVIFDEDDLVEQKDSIYYDYENDVRENFRKAKIMEVPQ